MRVHPPGKAPDRSCPRIQQNRMAQPSWKQYLGKGHRLDHLLHSTQKGQGQKYDHPEMCNDVAATERG